MRDLNPDAKYDIFCGPDRRKVATLTGRELEEKGFRVQLDKPVDGELYEITKVGK